MAIVGSGLAGLSTAVELLDQVSKPSASPFLAIHEAMQDLTR